MTGRYPRSSLGFEEVMELVYPLSSFGIDGAGHLFAVSLGEELYELT
jgi:hypothetical protein